MTVRDISAIKIGVRHRTDMGDIKKLAQSIADVGLLHPIVVSPDGVLIAGQRRLAACQLLGWTAAPVTEVDLVEIVRGEFGENGERKDFLPSEIDAIRRAIEPAEKAAAKERMLAGKSDPEESFLRGNEERAPQTRDNIGAFAGVSGRTVEKIAKVVEAAERNPEKFAPLVAEMDRTGKVDGAYRKLRQKEDEDKRLVLKPATGRFRTIVVDPPWDHEGLSIASRGRPQYAVMSLEELRKLGVPEWSADECHLYLWTTNNFLLKAGELIGAWGFDYKTLLTWVKPRIGLGSYFHSSTEQCLFATRGQVMTRARDIPTHFAAPVGAHSLKPTEFFALAEKASYPPFLEVFARTEREGWSSWGAGVSGRSVEKIAKVVDAAGDRIAAKIEAAR